jgi:hypothetical protein
MALADERIDQLTRLTSHSALRIPASDLTVPETPVTGYITPEDVLDNVVAEGEILGRLSGGSPAGLTPSQVLTLLFTSDFPENVGITFTPPSASGKYAGPTEGGTSGSALDFGHLLYQDSGTSTWKLASGASSPSAINRLSMCIQAAAGSGQAIDVLLEGPIRADSLFPDMPAGAPVYMSTVSGMITPTAPSGAGNVIRIIGHVMFAKTIWFKADNTTVEHV